MVGGVSGDEDIEGLVRLAVGSVGAAPGFARHPVECATNGTRTRECTDTTRADLLGNPRNNTCDTAYDSSERDAITLHLRARIRTEIDESTRQLPKRDVDTKSVRLSEN